MSAAGTGTGSRRRFSQTRAPSASDEVRCARFLEHPLRYTRWAALPFALVYLILMAHRLEGAIVSTNLDADAASAPVISQLFGVAPAHANVVLGEFGWYATLLFDLATKWLPHHRQVWEGAPYAMALAGAGLAASSVWQVAGKWAAGLCAVLLICASPATVGLLLSTTQHAPDWFCLALLGAFLVVLERRATTLPWPLLAALVLVIGTIVGVNAGSDPLAALAAVAPFALALIATALHVPGRHSRRALWTGVATLATIAIAWASTAIVMSALSVAPEPGLDTTTLTLGAKTGTNFHLWWKSIVVLGNGKYLGRPSTLGSALAFVCAVLSIAAVVSLPWLGWRALRRRNRGTGDSPAGTSTDALTAATKAFYVFWCSSAIVLTLAFLFSAAPVDIGADRYLVGLLYAAAAVVPAAAAGHRRIEAAVLAGTCLFALGGIVSLADGATSRLRAFHPPPLTASQAQQVAQIAARHHLSIGYAGYWEAAPITWATAFRVEVYPVSVCNGGANLCRFDLHFISSWYEPRAHVDSFLLVDDLTNESINAPTPDLGRPVAVYRIGQLAMYAYGYDIATKVKVT
ncbi:MAG: hypothetical protein ACLP4R_05425 [Solirubrobacteraceae bacterium]